MRTVSSIWPWCSLGEQGRITDLIWTYSRMRLALEKWVQLQVQVQVQEVVSIKLRFLFKVSFQWFVRTCVLINFSLRGGKIVNKKQWVSELTSKNGICRNWVHFVKFFVLMVLHCVACNTFAWITMQVLKFSFWGGIRLNLLTVLLKMVSVGRWCTL